MRRISIVLLVAALACFATMANAGESTAETKVHGTVFGHWYMDLSDQDPATEGDQKNNDFGLTRAYVTVKSKLSENTMGRVTFDFMEDGEDGHRYDALVKYAYIDWKPTCFAKEYLKIRFGLQPTMYIAMMNYLWGHRYVTKTASDYHEFLTTADMGASVFFALGQEWKFGYAGVSILNGAGYKDIEEANKQKDFNVFARITPLQDNPKFKGTTLGGQFYKGTQNVAIADSVDAGDYKHDLFSVGGLVAYDGTIDVGGEFNSLSWGEGPGIDATTKTALTIFTTIYLAGLIQASQALHTLNVFASYGIYDPCTDAEFDEDKEKTMLIGLECAPAKGVKTSLVYNSTSFDEEGKDNNNGFSFNTMIDF